MKGIGDAIILIHDPLGYSDKIFKHELSIKMLENKVKSILFSCYFIEPALHCTCTHPAGVSGITESRVCTKLAVVFERIKSIVV